MHKIRKNSNFHLKIASIFIKKWIKIFDLIENDGLIPDGILGVGDDECLLAAIEERHSDERVRWVLHGRQEVLKIFHWKEIQK